MLSKSKSSKSKHPWALPRAGVYFQNSWVVRASPAVLSMWFQTAKLDEEKSKYAGLAEENGFGSS
jgi:hypothetical protein